ncbi:MAG: RluA family pseudouridine synthase [Chlamydiae bacterium]|nr:RluA family pseudouridine synthase [Chlamydiota bacterium]
MKKLLVKSPIKLLDALREIHPNSSNNTLRDLLKNKLVFVDETIEVKANHDLHVGQTVRIGAPPRTISCDVEILYSDKHLIVIDKPVGLLSVPLDEKNAVHALGILQRHFHSSQIFAVHRIDKETSGVLIFARGKLSTIELNKMFKKHDFKRIYVAIVEGEVKKDKGVWESRLIEFKDFEVRTTDNPEEGKIATTNYRVLKKTKNYSFLQLELETGRKHQIRVQCKEAGHPIVGDKKYNPLTSNPVHRICLHAHILEFIHPFTGAKMSFSAPIPKEFAKLGFN